MERHDLHDEGCWLLVTAMMVLATMLTIALTSFAMVDRGQKHSLDQRQRESALNLAEGVLYSQGFALAQKWPGNAVAGAGMPVTCTQLAPAAAHADVCPQSSTLADAQRSAETANFANSDSLSDVTWTTRVRDNGGPDLAGSFVPGVAADATQSGTNIRSGAAYTCPGPCKWDANGDRQLWVQARAVVQGKARNIVALLKREQFDEPFPRNGLTAGSLRTPNSGNKTVINATGSQVVVRCTTTTSECTDYNAAKIQILPQTIVRDPTTTHCNDPGGGVVYNPAVEPAIVIMPRGTLYFQSVFHGLIYMATSRDRTGMCCRPGTTPRSTAASRSTDPGASRPVRPAATSRRSRTSRTPSTSCRATAQPGSCGTAGASCRPTEMSRRRRGR